ncbi:MAG: hypothetical protein KKB90_09495 [Actinobacteria bacterium]|nr:hypothetical protein [Actinomycetota bacterium]MCG2820175.1 DUF5719 family protein [Actinomycetes bacterium]MBU4219176.1 hypothetical protein [Actinomycetota bacterium]MBU4359019.1 hypothetical protein [Actinomycetota bacterium]MBU4392970.1 hypothetical protein [Actinomycetota bacterium]
MDSEGILVAQKITPDGNIAWAPDCVQVSTLAVEERWPSIEPDGMGGAYICWGWGTYSRGGTLYLQHLDSDGELFDGWEKEGKAVVSGPEVSPSIGLIADSAGGVYVGFYNDGVKSYLRYDPNGTVHPGWPNEGKRVCTEGEFHVFIRTKLLSDGGLLAAWEGRRTDEWSDVYEGIYVQRIDPDGDYHKGWDPEGKLIYEQFDDEYSNFYTDSMIPEDKDWMLLSWNKNPYGIVGLYIDENGEPLPGWSSEGKLLIPDSEFPGNPNPNLGTEYYWGTTTDGAGGALLRWEDRGTDDLRVAHIDEKGCFDPVWGGEAGKVLRSGDGSPFSYEDGGAPDGAGGLFIRDYYWLHHITNQATAAEGWPDKGLLISTTDSLDAACGETLGLIYIWSEDRDGTGDRLYAQKITDPSNFSTYVLVQNPGEKQANVNVEFMIPGGFTRSETVTVPANSRKTIDVMEYLAGREVSTKVTSVTADTPVICERSMYFDYKGTYEGGHDCTGVTAPGTTWYLAEGYTANRFDTYLLLQNPGENTAEVTVTYMLPGSATVEGTYTVPAHSRYTVSVDAVPGLESTELSMKIDSSAPICAERAMYFNYYGRIGGHDQAAIGSPEKTWYLPEGYTAEEFDTYVLVQNPGDTEASVTYTYMNDEGAVIPVEEKVGPHSRFTVKADDIPELSSCEFSTKVSSNVPVIAERAMYFDYKGKAGGHDSVGATSPSPTWYLAEGYTAGEFDTYVLMQNTGDTTATVEATYMLPWGDPVVETYDILPNSRYTVKLDDIPGLEATEVSTKLETTGGTGIIAERAIYFTYQGKWSGGHDAIGVTQPSATWYFAEGYTGY